METKSLVVFLNEIDDSRKAKGKRHEQLSILVIMIMSMLCGQTSLKSIARFARAHRSELIKYIPLPRDKVPSYSTIQRISHRLDASKVCGVFNSWMQQYMKPEPIAADGKSIASTVSNAKDS